MTGKRTVEIAPHAGFCFGVRRAVEALEAETDGIVFNPNSLTVLENAYVEDVDFNEEERYQFVRNGYFALDKDSTEDKLVFNRTITLKETKKAKI